MKCRECKWFREPSKCTNLMIANKGYLFGSDKKSKDLSKHRIELIERLNLCSFHELKEKTQK